MLLKHTELRDFALGTNRYHAPFPHQVVLVLDYMDECIEWCTRQFGPPANRPVEEGFIGYYKVHQELDWMWSPDDRGYLYFNRSADAIMAKLAWGRGSARAAPARAH